MNKERILNYIQSLLPISIEKAQLLTESFRFIELPKGEFLIQENGLCNTSYYLEAGYVRSYLLDINGQEITTNLFASGSFVNDSLAFFKRQLAKESYQTLTTCSAWAIDYQDVQNNFHTIPEFREFGRLILVTNYSNLHERMIGMIKESAETRYLKLMEQHPDIFQNVPLKIIASYLGITDTSLSRIRKDVTKK